MNSPWAPAAGCKRDGGQARDLGQDLLQLEQHLQHALRVLFGLIGMQVGDARQSGQPLVPLGVVLHRATAERIEMCVDRHVERRQIDEMANDVGLGQLGQGRHFGTQLGCRNQFLESLGRDVAGGKYAAAPARMAQLEE